MSLSPALQELQAEAGSELEILTNEADARFQAFAAGWTNVGRQIPGAIVLPASEEQIRTTVQWAVRSSVPFVAKSGGHSEWSSIGKDGIMIHLAKYSGIEVDVQAKRAVLRGSILSKDVAVALAAASTFTALGNGNLVGAIPYFLGGGVSITTSTTGFGSDQILAARMIDARGNLVVVTEESEPDLLYAIRGAGQFFGLVTELTIKIHPLTALGNNDGHIWTGLFVYPLARVKDVADTMKVLMDDSSKTTAGLMMLASPPPAGKPALVISARYVGDPKDAEAAYKPLYELQPLVAKGGPVPIHNASDARVDLCAKGDFKRFSVIGLKNFDINKFLEVIHVYKKLVMECPDAIKTAFMFQWDSRFPQQHGFESAMSLHDTRYWQNNVVWHTDSSNRKKVDDYNDQVIAIMRGSNESEYSDYQNATRSGPIQLRFRGSGKLGKLKALKKKWDPTGVFTRQLLD